MNKGAGWFCAATQLGQHSTAAALSPAFAALLTRASDLLFAYFFALRLVRPALLSTSSSAEIDSRSAGLFGFG